MKKITMNMNIKTYQQIASIDTGSTTYDEQIITILGIDKNQTIDKISAEITKLTQITPYTIKRNSFRLNGKRYKIEKDFIELTYEQFTRLDSLIAEEDNIGNLHKLLSIYVRPTDWFGRIKPFNLKTQEKIYNELLDMNMDFAQGLMLLFFSNATRCINNINISYLNQIKLMEYNQPTKNKLNKLRNTLAGILQRKPYQTTRF